MRSHKRSLGALASALLLGAGLGGATSASAQERPPPPGQGLGWGSSRGHDERRGNDGIVPPSVWSTERFEFYTTQNPGYPQVEGDTLVLVPDNRSGAAGMVFLREPLRPPFSVQLEYSIFDDDGGSPWASGDGLVLMFGRKQPSPSISLPTGGGRGMVRDGSGYGVHLPIYGNERGLVLTDGSGRTLSSRRNRDVYNHGRWSTLRVDVGLDRIQVFLDGRQQLDWRGRVDTTFAGLAVGAGTGSADGQHAVRNLRIDRGTVVEAPPAPPPPAPLPPAPQPPPAHEGELIFNGGFEQPALNPRSWKALRDLPGWKRSSGRVIEVQNRVAGNPAEGNQHVELDGTDSTGIYQDVATRPGQMYLLRFAFSARPGTPPQDNLLEVLWNGQRIAQLSASGKGASDTSWTHLVLPVMAISNMSHLEFKDLGRSNGSGTYLDDVSLQMMP